MSHSNLKKVTESIVKLYWQSNTVADYTAKEAWQNSLTRSVSDDLGSEIFSIAKSGDIKPQDIRNFTQKHKSEIDQRFKETSSNFMGFFKKYAANESIISLCLFSNPEHLDKRLQEKLYNMYDYYSREQSVSWSRLHGGISGSADKYIGGEALMWFFSNVVGPAILWELTKKAISTFLHKAKEKTASDITTSNSELYGCITLLDLSNQEIEQLSEHWYRNYNRFILNLSVKERHVIQQLISYQEPIENPIPEVLLEREFICAIECNPKENVTILFPKVIRFFERTS